jgi:hypothetical protein
MRLRATIIGVSALVTAWAAVGPLGSALAADGVIVYERPSGNGAKQRILDYWTPQRMRRAEPLDVNVGSRGAAVAGASDQAGAPAYVPPAAPGASAAAARSGLVPTAKPRAVFDAGPVPDPDIAPNTTNGKIYGRIKGLGAYECSGTVVDAANLSTIFTAGHCVADARAGLAKKLVFIPSYNRKARPFGTFVFERIVVTKQWAERANFNYDFSAVVLSPLDGVALQTAVGARGIAFNQPKKQDYQAFGYPFNRKRGQVMWTCVSRFVQNDPHPVGGGTLPFGIGCDMGPGASGGGWIINGTTLNSVSSFGYDPRPDLLYGPYLGGTAQRIYNTAAATPVP